MQFYINLKYVGTDLMEKEETYKTVKPLNE